MKDRLEAAIAEIRSNRSIIIFDEASIKSGVVLRILSLLEWNPFDVNEVKPEYKSLSLINWSYLNMET